MDESITHSRRNKFVIFPWGEAFAHSFKALQWKLYTEPLLLVYKVEVYSSESIYYFANAQFLKPEVMMFISRAYV